MSEALVVETLGRAFGGVRAVAGVSFRVATGERLAVIGPNGAGKSTLFALIGGQIQPDHGRILLNGRDITRLPPERRARLGLGRTFQIPRAFTPLTVSQAIRSGARLLSNRKDADDLAKRILTRLSLEPLSEVATGSLPYGDLRRLDLALALASRPRVLLMDEPVAGMAPKERAALMTLVATVAREDRLSVVFTEHDMGVVFQHATRVIVMDRGQIIADGPPQNVRVDPAVRARYLGE